MAIYFICPSQSKPAGGVKQIYRQVDVLNKSGLKAAVVQSDGEPRCSWFENSTTICPLSALKLNYAEDYLVIPEIFGEDLVASMGSFVGGVKKVIFNQNCYYTFNGYGVRPAVMNSPYLSEEVVATLVVSEDSESFLRYAFPSKKILRIVNGVDSKLFSFQADKSQKIAFMPRKLTDEIERVLNICKFRRILEDYQFSMIDGQTYQRVAETLKEASIFLSFSTREGFGLPPLEAMACGCIVVGYHGMGGREYFRPEFSYPIEAENTLAYAKAIESIIETMRNDPGKIEDQRVEASQFVQKNYSLEIEEQSILAAWQAILAL